MTRAAKFVGKNESMEGFECFEAEKKGNYQSRQFVQSGTGN